MSLPLADRVSDRAQELVGTTLRGKWKLERILGSGGMATVYEATHRNQARAAIKLLHPELALNKEVTTRFLREGYVANSVDHPGTVKVLDDDLTVDGCPYLVMELLDGETVEDRAMRKGGSLPLAEVMALADNVLSILVAAHAAGVVHRDIKPENLFLTRSGELKILDFGIARLREMTPERQQTRAGSLMGTPAYMAPEQARGRWSEVNERTDIWALGATLFNLITCRFVHEAGTVQEQIIAAATTPAPSLGEVDPNVPPDIVEIVDRALSFDNADRYGSAMEMREAVRNASGHVEDAAPLTLPIPSAPEAPTILAEADLDTLSTLTNRPVARTADDLEPAKKTNRLFVMTTLGLSVVVLVLLFIVARAGFGTPDAEGKAAASPEAPAVTELAPPAKDSVKVKPTESVASAPAPSSSAAPKASGEQAAPKAAHKAVVKKPAVAVKSPKAPTAPKPTTKPSGKKPPASSLFDKRW